MDDFEAAGHEMAARMSQDEELRRLSWQWLRLASRYEYSYHFNWLGRPIIQFPQDILALQEIVWAVQPDLIVETGVARGGSLVFYASLLEILGGDRRVVGIDIDIRSHNRAALESHPLFRRMTLLEGSSTDPRIVASVRDLAHGRSRVLVVLDSLHTHDHVLAELEAYAPLVQPPSYVVVLDTIIEDMPEDFSKDRPWGPGNNPRTAVREFLRGCDRFVVDEYVEAKLLISVAPGGYLRCVKV
jgi:cephalosporin hydroxylase